MKDKNKINNHALHNPHTAITLSDGVDKYLQDLTLRNYSDKTVYEYKLRLKIFLR